MTRASERPSCTAPDAPGVLMVTGAYYPELSGGGLQCRELVRALRDRVRFSVLTTTTDASLPAVDEQDRIPVYRVRVDPVRPAWSPRAAVGIMMASLRARHRFSIVHLHGFSRKSVLLVWLARLLRKQIAIKITSVGDDDPLAVKARGKLSYWSYVRASTFFGVSPGVQARYEASGLPADRFQLIPNGVDVRRFRPADPGESRALREELGLPPTGSIVLFVGFFSHEKAPDRLFEAWARLEPQLGPSTLVFVGATRSKYFEIDHRLAELIRQGARALPADRQVIFVESTLEIEKYYRAADAFVLPSVREGLPNALLEAMASGAACVATRLPGITDTVIADGINGLLVDTRDTDALAAAIQSLVADPSRTRALGSRARETIVAHYTIESVADRYFEAYRALDPVSGIAGRALACP